VGNTEEFTVIEFCAGYCGISEGLRRVIPNVRVVAVVEIEAFCVANLVAKMEAGQLDAAPVWTDVKTFPLLGGHFGSKVRCVTAGYPCQPFSQSGKRKGAADPRHLWPYIRESIDVIRPEWVFLENVTGHISLGLREVLTDLVTIGYRVETDSGEPTWGIFSAEEVGAPHRRERLFILAHADGAETGLGESGDSGQGRQPADTQQSTALRQEHRAAGSTGISSAGVVPNTDCQWQSQQKGGVGKGGRRAEYGGEKLADAENAVRRGRGLAEQKKKRLRRGGPGVNRSELADANHAGLQGGIQNACQERRQDERRYAARCGEIVRWPAGQGQYQHDWEPPRTIEPAVGGDAYGYSDRLVRSTCRHDELRMCGNGVVPQTAAKAWQVLYERWIRNERAGNE